MGIDTPPEFLAVAVRHLVIEQRDMEWSSRSVGLIQKWQSLVGGRCADGIDTDARELSLQDLTIRGMIVDRENALSLKRARALRPHPWGLGGDAESSRKPEIRSRPFAALDAHLPAHELRQLLDDG